VSRTRLFVEDYPAYPKGPVYARPTEGSRRQTLSSTTCERYSHRHGRDRLTMLVVDVKPDLTKHLAVREKRRAVISRAAE